MSQPESLCAQCARNQKTCCQQVEIFVTRGDVARIEIETGETDFFEFAAPQNVAYLDHDDDPTWRDAVFRSDGTRRVLKRQPNEDCHFLTPTGCRLSAGARPLVCRLYPYEYNDEELNNDPAIGCPTHLITSNLPLLTVLNMPRDVAERSRAQLYAEIRQERREFVMTHER